VEELFRTDTACVGPLPGRVIKAHFGSLQGVFDGSIVTINSV
jgi:hypothetical protein